MTKRLQIYKCETCGNIVELLHEGVGELVCCDEPMILFRANTVDAAREKHLPVMEKIGMGTHVQVGSDPHPMEEKHYIEWIELVTKDNKSVRKFLNPGEKPEAVFCELPEGCEVREYCNVHGLWMA